MTSPTIPIAIPIFAPLEIPPDFSLFGLGEVVGLEVVVELTDTDVEDDLVELERVEDVVEVACNFTIAESVAWYATSIAGAYMVLSSVRIVLVTTLVAPTTDAVATVCPPARKVTHRCAELSV